MKNQKTSKTIKTKKQVKVDPAMIDVNTNLALPYGDPTKFELPEGHLDHFEIEAPKNNKKVSNEPKKANNKVKFPVKNRIGSLIVVEGSDGSGKSTQLEILKQTLEANGFKVLLSTWNSSLAIRPLSKKIKKIFEYDKIVEPETFSMQYASDMYDRYYKEIKPALDAGVIVLCDRYKFTGLARDVARGVERKFVEHIYSLLPDPDLTLFFRVDVDVAVDRVINRSKHVPKFYEAGMDRKFSDNIVESFKIFQQKILNEYDDMSSKYDFNVFDGTKYIYETVPEVKQVVGDYFKAKYNVNI